MLNKLLAFLKRYRMLEPGDRVVCAVSGGADSMALLFAMYLLAPKLQIQVSAAHFNHRLRGKESDRDEDFVRDFCDGYRIPLTVGSGQVLPGKKGLEAAARNARYEFLRSLPGKLATAHTANDNAETVLMHLVRGTGLKGLGGIVPVMDGLIRPMLSVTRQEVLDFLEEYHIPYVEDSSNQTDQFLRNRLRHRVMPLLEMENPQLAENVSAMALRLREDEALLSGLGSVTADVDVLRQMPSAIRSRSLSAFLENSGVREPEAEHIALLERLVMSERPSARASFPKGITVTREYGKLAVCQNAPPLQTRDLACPGVTDIPELGMRVRCELAGEAKNGGYFVAPQGDMILRHRLSGDAISLAGGTKSLKKLFIDRRVPADQRLRIPVIADDLGVICVYGVGSDMRRNAGHISGVMIYFEEIHPMKTDEDREMVQGEDSL